jgi:hypothetical protein
MGIPRHRSCGQFNIEHAVASLDETVISRPGQAEATHQAARLAIKGHQSAAAFHASEIQP